MRTARNLAVAAGLLLLPAFVEGRNPQYVSTWAPVPAKVDGTADTWSALLRPLSDLPMVIAVQNDADYLYLCLKTSNPKLKKQIILTGLTWLRGLVDSRGIPACKKSTSRTPAVIGSGGGRG